MAIMRPIQLLGLGMCAGLFAACESTNTATDANSDTKRVAVVQHQQQQQTVAQDEEVDEAHRNLWNAQHDVLVRDGNPNIRYY